MISVCHIITRLELGGAQENTLYTCQHLDRTQFRVALLFGPGGLLDPEATSIPALECVPVAALAREIDPWQDLRGLLALTETLEDQLARADGPLIVHTHSSKAGILGRMAAFWAQKRTQKPIRVVHTIHGFPFHAGQAPLIHAAFVQAERVAGRYTDVFVGVSRANLAEAMARGLIGKTQRSVLIRSGFTLSAFGDEERRAPARTALGLKPNQPLLLCISNFKPQKDPLTLLEAFALLAPRHPDARLAYAGDGPLRGAVEARIRTLGLDGRVFLLGWRRDVPDLMAASDVVVLASLFEGLPKTAVQALAARRPFVGTRVDGTAEVIRNGRNGYLTEPRDPRALADAMHRALVERPVDPADLARLGEWDADRMVAEQESLYRSLV